jgi:hypothetical protein
VLKPVIQEETTGCGIASVANVLGKTYSEMKAVANAMGIYAEDKSLWSDTQYVRKMLSSAGVETSPDEIPFESWSSLPDLALLSIKHHQENGKNFWHWVVFKRLKDQEHNKPQQSLPLVAGTTTTLRFCVGPCEGR